MKIIPFYSKTLFKYLKSILHQNLMIFLIEFKKNKKGFLYMVNNSIPENIIKIQKKLASLEKDSRNYKKYTKILAKHIKSHTMKKRVNSHIKTIETIEKIEQEVKKES